MIPKIIHQIWVGDQGKRPYKMMDTWRDMNPSWEYKLWTEENLPPMINRSHFDAYGPYCGKADILRYEILKQQGGFYIDADSDCIKPLEDFLIDNDSFACYESEQHRPGLVANGYLAGVKDCQLFDILIQRISKMVPAHMNGMAPPWLLTGPTLLTNSIKENNYTKIKVYPSHYFIPEHFCGGSYTGDGHVFCRQYWGSTHTGYGTMGR